MNHFKFLEKINFPTKLLHPNTLLELPTVVLVCNNDIGWLGRDGAWWCLVVDHRDNFVYLDIFGGARRTKKGVGSKTQHF